MLTRKHLEALRRFEIERVLALVPAPRGAALEIGAAGGFQAALLAEQFQSVDAIDLPESIPPGAASFEVQPYDGATLPFPDARFDVVFSSNVLEHIAHVEDFQAEIRRVLKPGGRALHVLPSASWRFWTIVTHYLDLPARVLARLKAGSAAPRPAGSGTAPPAPGTGVGWKAKFLNLLLERRHGERGTTLGEHYLFSRFAWLPLFRRHGFVVERAIPLGLFYTGYSLFDRALGIAARRRLAALLGSATILYVLRDERSPP